MTPEHIKKLYKAGNTTEAIKKRVKTSIERDNYNQHSKRMRELKGRPVLQYDLSGNFIKEWDCLSSAAESLGDKKYKKNISRACYGGRETYKGFVWKYKIEST